MYSCTVTSNCRRVSLRIGSAGRANAVRYSLYRVACVRDRWGSISRRLRCLLVNVVDQNSGRTAKPTHRDEQRHVIIEYSIRRTRESTIFPRADKDQTHLSFSGISPLLSLSLSRALDWQQLVPSDSCERRRRRARQKSTREQNEGDDVNCYYAQTPSGWCPGNSAPVFQSISVLSLHSALLFISI